MKLTKFATALLIAGMGVSFAASAKVTVFAAASMTDALKQIADQYQTEKPNNTVVFSFASSSTLAKQVEEGAPADLFISASNKWMKYLSDKNLTVKETEKVLAGNELVDVYKRQTLGYAMREEQGVWQDSLGLDSSYGLKGQLVGAVNQFFTALNKWHQDLQKAHNIEKWREKLTALLTDFFVQNEETADTLFYIQDCINAFADDLLTVNFEETLQADVIAEVMSARLEETPNSLSLIHI